MKRILTLLAAAIAALCFPAPVLAQFTTVSASGTGGAGHLVANGTVYWQPVTGFRIGTSSGQALNVPYSATVTTGAFSLSVPDASLSNPTYPCYAVTVIDNLTGNTLIGAGLAADGIHVNTGGAYGCVQPTGSIWSFDAYIPATPPGALVVAGPTGPTGATGFTNWRGAWAATTAYAKNDGYVEATNGYIVIAAYTSGSTFGSTDTTNTVQVAAGCTLTGCTMGGAIGFSGPTAAPETVANLLSGSGQGIWHRLGVVIYPLATLPNPWGTGEVSILPPGSTPPNTCFVLPAYYSDCWKGTFTGPEGIFYGESADGINNWTWATGLQALGTIVDAHSRSRLYYCNGASTACINGDYYLYAANAANTQIDLYVSTSPLTFPSTPTYAAVLTPASAPGSWGTFTNIDNSTGIFVGNTFFVFWTFESGAGEFSTTDMHTFTPVGSALAFPAPYATRSPIYTVNGTYYTWTHSIVDNTIHRMSSATLNGPWTDALGGTPEYYRQNLDEGVNLTTAGGNYGGQTVDPYVTQYNGKTYMYYSSAQNNNGGSPPSFPSYAQAKLAVADMPISSVIQTNGGTDGTPENSGPLGLIFDYYTAGINFQNRPLENAGPLSIKFINCLTDCEMAAPAGHVLEFSSNGNSPFAVGTVVLDTANSFRPWANDGASLGTAGQSFSDLHVANNQVSVDSSGNLKANTVYPGADAASYSGITGAAWLGVVSKFFQNADATPYAGRPFACNSTNLFARIAITDSVTATPGTVVSAGGGTYNIPIECIENTTGSVYEWIVD